MSKKLTKRAEDYSKWYNEIILKADLAENSAVRGCMVIKPYGFAIWENMQKELDRMFKETGHQNAYFPLFVPKSLFEAEEKNAEGFAKECAVVTHYRLQNDPEKEGKLRVDPEAKLEEELIVRPTSEAIIWNTYKGWIQSYRDLPLLINQWANVVRWEMRTRLFLRTAEFLWQEGHTAHATKNEALIESKLMQDVYAKFAEEFMAMPVVKGFKSESERFAGAEETYTIEALMQDGKALQAGTSHFLGQNFAKAFDVKYTSKEGKQEYVWATSWGVSTRLIGTLIMAHSDDDGLLMPPAIASQQVIIIPVIPKPEFEDAILEVCEELRSQIVQQSYLGQPVRAKVDKRDSNAGTKKWDWVKKGVPIRVEIGPRDLENGKLCYQLRTEEPTQKYFVESEGWAAKVPQLLANIHDQLLIKATNLRDNNMVYCDNINDFEANWDDQGDTKWLVTPWAGSNEEEEELSKKWQISIRCLPNHDKLPASISEKLTHSAHCFKSGKSTNTLAIWAKSY